MNANKETLPKQNILILSRTIFPLLVPRAHRATELAKELARQGHKVTLAAVLGHYDYTDFEKSTGITVKDLGVSIFEWHTSAGDLHLSLWKKGVIFLLHRLFCFPDILIANRVVRFLKSEQSYDRIITIAIPYSIHWGMAYAKRHFRQFNNTIWASDCGDPFMGSPHSNNPFYFKWVEKWWCKSTDYIVVPAEESINGYYPEFREKIRVIPQGFVFDSSILADYKKNRVPTFAYSGMVYPGKRDPRRFLDYLAHKKDDFLFVVYTNKPALFLPYLNILGEKMVIRDYIPHDQLIHTLSTMDFLINIKNESSVQVPSKLIDYYLTHRPILEISSSFEEIEVFERFFIGDYSKQLIIDNPERFNITNVAKAFLAL